MRLYYYYLLPFRVFHISVSWWFFPGVWVTASLLKSPGLFSVFWPFSIMLSFGWFPLVCQLPSHQRPFNNLLVTMPKAPITIGIIVTFMFHSFFNSLARSRYLSFFSHSYSVLFCGQLEQQCRQFCKFSFLLIIIRSVLLAEIRWSVCMSKSHGCLLFLF